MEKLKAIGHSLTHPKCYGCDKPIEDGEYIKAEGHFFHMDHFLCFKCSKPLNEGYIMHKHHAYCKEDFVEQFQPKCYKCHEPITDKGFVITVDDEELHFHPQCFVCGACGSVIDGGYSVDIDKNIICFRCPPQLFPKKSDHSTIPSDIRKI